MVPHLATNWAISRLSAQIGRDAEFSRFYGRGWDPPGCAHIYTQCQDEISFSSPSPCEVWLPRSLGLCTMDASGFYRLRITNLRWDHQCIGRCLLPASRIKVSLFNHILLPSSHCRYSLVLVADPRCPQEVLTQAELYRRYYTRRYISHIYPCMMSALV